MKPEHVAWFWDGYLAKGKFHLLGGDPGTSKSTIAIDLAARITRGADWPDGSKNEQGPAHVVIWSGEDAASDTLLPRFMLAGGNRDLAHFVRADAVVGGKDFDISVHVPQLEAAAVAVREQSDGIPIGLFIVDPVANLAPADNSQNAKIRQYLNPLVKFGERQGVAILGISHLSKGTEKRGSTQRITGSLAFAALARLVLFASKVAGDPESRRIFSRGKSNISADSGGYYYKVNEIPVTIDGSTRPVSGIEWGAPFHGNADDALRKAEADQRHSNKIQSPALDNAKTFLKKALADGPVPAKEIVKDARDGHGITPATLTRAKEKLGIESEKIGAGKDSYWTWAMPDIEDDPTSLF